MPAVHSDATPEIFRVGGVPSPPRRYAQALAVKLGRTGWQRGGAAARGRPQALIRVDEFPHARAFDPDGPFGTDAYRRFHAVLAEAEVPYLLAVTPRISRDYLDPEVTEWRPLEDGEIAALREYEAEGVAFGLHGLDHRTRHTSPRRHSELCGLSPAAAAERIDAARAALAGVGIETPVFVPPFNRLDAAQYPLLAERFEVVCGGPESIRLLGLAPTPAWRGDAVYLPSYPPLYGRAAEVAPEIERMIDAGEALWAPVTLHWGWELDDDFAALRRLCERLAAVAAPWGRFLEAVRESRSAA
jgi:peptidoglycan/xylan/chitin deacetylase (PgdA/CDA1 family)